MIVKHSSDIAGEALKKGVVMKWAISQKDGAENFCMRIIEAAPGTEGPPLHQHDYEHEMYILEGQGIVVGNDGEKKFKQGDVIFIPPNEKHQIKHPAGIRFI